MEFVKVFVIIVTISGNNNIGFTSQTIGPYRDHITCETALTYVKRNMTIQEGICISYDLPKRTILDRDTK